MSKIFIVDDGFEIYVRRNKDKYIKLDNEAKYDGLDIEFEWIIPDSEVLDVEYAKKHNITGRIIATKKPISPSTNMRGITIFSRQKLVNNPEYFSDNQSSHVFSYITGKLTADFIDDLPEDVISTNRQSLNWDHPDVSQLRVKLQKMMRAIEMDWRKKRSTKRVNDISEKVGVDIEDWFEKIPESVRNSVGPLLRTVVEDSELGSNEQAEAISNLRKLAPDYTYFHYRQLHPRIREVSKKNYEDGNYYAAFLEAMKRYIAECRKKAQVANVGNENSQLEQALKLKPVVLSAIGEYKKSDGSDFHPDTVKNIQEAFRELSLAIYKGGRHPLSHEEIIELKRSDLFSEADCLDALSLLSHLFKRLDNSKKI